MVNKVGIKGFGLIQLPVITYPDKDVYVSEVPFINVASQGKTIDTSIKNLREAVELYFEGEDVEKIIKDKFLITSSVFTSTMTFDLNSKSDIKTPANCHVR